jgi:hypothetical protein
LRGGQSSGGGRSAGPPANRGAPPGGSVRVRVRRGGGDSRTRGRSAGCWPGPSRRSGGRGGNARPAPAAWRGLARGLPRKPVVREAKRGERQTDGA